MKRLFTTLLAAMTAASILTAAEPMPDGHQLTDLWVKYQEAQKADRPVKEAEILGQIKKEAFQKRLPVDFWDAATEYVYTVRRRDWKQGNSLREALQKEVADYDSPIITFLWMREWGGSNRNELWKYIQEHPLQGNTPALHRGVDGLLNGALSYFIDTDQEWALWTLLGEDDAKEAIAAAVKGRYPQEGALKYILLNRSDKEKAEMRSALQEIADAYPGTALALYPEGDLLQMEMQDMEEAKASADKYKEFHLKCKAFEKRRAGFKQSEAVIAKGCTTVESLVKALESKELQLSVEDKTIVVKFRNLADAKLSLNKDKKTLASWNAINPKGSFYVYDTLRLALPVLEDGEYRLEAVNGKTDAHVTYSQYTLSIATRTDADGPKVYVADYKTGKPLSKATVLLFKGDKEVASTQMKLDGFTTLPSAFVKVINDHPKTWYLLVAVSGERKSLSVSVNRRAVSYVADNSVKCNVYRDRGAYNPGDSLQFKAVVYQGDPMLKMEVCKGHKLDIRLSDSEGNVLETKSLSTNQWGSASGAFLLPKGLRNGMFSLEVTGKGQILCRDFFRVDEYVLPSFDLSFDKRTQLYMEGSLVPVSGKVTSYSGHGLSGAKAVISVQRWGTTVLEAEAPLKADGLFRFEVPAMESGWYNAQVSVVDATGETLSFTDGFYIGRDLGVNIKLSGTKDAVLAFSSDGAYRYRSFSPRYVVEGDELSAVFQAVDAGGNPVPLNVKYELGHIQADAPSGEEVGIKLPGSGLYTLKASVEAALESGEKVQASSEITVLALHPGQSKLDVPDTRFFISGPLNVKDRIEAKVASSEGDAWIVTSVYGKDCQLLESGLQLVRKGDICSMEWEYKQSWPDAVRLILYYFFDGRSVKYEREYRRECTRLSLPLQFTSFRDKAYPGTRYTFTLKTEPGVEALAAAWDVALDAVAANSWYTVSQRDYSVPSVSISASCGTEGTSYYRPDVFYSINHASLARTKSVSFDAVDDVMAEEEIAAPAAAGIQEDVPVRSEMLQALTFQPHLLSAKDGSLSFSFSTSDKLSTYYVRVYAHDKNMRNAVAEEKMLVTIPVKVALQEPRFLYEGDLWEAAVTVSSIADIPVSGVLSLSWKGGSAQVPVTVPAGETVTKVIPVVVSAPTCGEVAFTASFIAPEFSDALRFTVPVYPAAQTLTEAHSAVLHPGEDLDALVQELRSRFVNVPGKDAVLKEITVLDMVRDAIPSHVEPKGNDVLSLSEALYVRLIAGSFVVDAPQDDILSSIMACRNADGGFAWFEGMTSSPVITAVLLERFARLRDRGFEVPDLTSAVKYLDARQFGEAKPLWCGYLSDAQYMHVRAMYASVPLTAKPGKEFKKAAKNYLTPSAKDGRGLQGQILAKARRLLTLRNLLEREGGIALAKAWGLSLAKTRIKASIKADTASLLEYAVRHRDGGWYYPNAVMPWRGLLESEAYAHALLCQLFSPEANTVSASGSASEIADGIRLWLMLQKETQKWDAEPAFIDAITAVLDGSPAVLDTKVVALSASYTAPFKDIKASGNGFSVERRFYMGETEILPGNSVRVGDRIRVVYKIWNAENRSFVKLTVGREAALNPVQQLSGHVGYGFIRPLRHGLAWGFVPQGYRNVKASATEYFFDSYPEESTEISEEFYVTRAGTFQAPSVVIESLYAPHYRANSQYRNPLVSTL